MFVTINGKKILVIISSILFSLMILFAVSSNSNAIVTQSNSWGLSYEGNEKSPTGNATAEYLKSFDAFYLGNINEKKVYLTFDAGYEAGYTKTILQALKNQNVKATFFVVGTYMRDNPELVKQMVDEGHIVGNHTQSHPNMSKMSTLEDFKNQICPVEEKYKELTGMEMSKFYRPPQGIFNEENLQMAQSLGYKTIFWSVAYVDWYKDKQPSRETAFNTLLPRIHPGAIILLHSTSKTNSEILEEFITKIRDAGYTFGTLDEIN
ncbi:MAG: polysaccharide deacetylase family protein [Clostridia bacterium]|nr:polysaccharide deacetylase family protein [Clostridia bacterium]